MKGWNPYSGAFWESFWLLFGWVWLPLGSFWSLFGGQSCVRELSGKKEAKGGRPLENRLPFWDPFWTPFRHFFFRASGTQKRGSGRAFETRPVFLSLLESARRASGGFPSRRELNFHFCRRAQKGLPNGSQNGAFWAPKSELYSLWGTIGEKSVPQKLHRKKVAKSRLNKDYFGGTKISQNGHLGDLGVCWGPDGGPDSHNFQNDLP